ncbi:hypothetical protein EBB59_01565 [Lysobacter pythonis]|uniref:Uncharacterized protein n=2 Tax=Solilutibacter pythonis TaxID=2483112 RepID=A0A3M2I474_9GAMM|nr:hypothetical protein EBB59_01565 [Lysobacter pythonis]
MLALVALSSCAGMPRESDTDRLARYLAHAGKPVSSISYYTSSTGFDVIDDEHVLLMQGSSRNWLLRVSPPCLRYDAASPVLLVTSQMGQLSVNFDAVTSSSQPDMRCPIREIRPVDLKAVRAGEKAGAGKSH